REHTGEGTFVYQSMQDAVLNLCRIKLRNQIMLDNLGALPHYAVTLTGNGARQFLVLRTLKVTKLSVGLTRLKVGKLILTLMFTSLSKTVTRAGQQLPTLWVTQNGLLILALMAGTTVNYTRKKFTH